MHFGSRKKQVLGVQHRSGAGGLVKRGSRALWGAASGHLTWKTDIPVVQEKLFGVCLFGLLFFARSLLSFFTWQVFARAGGAAGAARCGGDTIIIRALL